MKIPPDETRLEDVLQSGFGNMPSPNFDAWCDRFPDAVRTLEQMPVTTKHRSPPSYRFWRDRSASRKVVVLTLMIITGLISVWLAAPLGTVVLADSIPGIDKLDTMTWTATFYGRVTSKDGKRTWIRTERRLFAYRHPGLYRETFLDDGGEARIVEITDASANRKLVLNLKQRTATLKQTMNAERDVRGPFAWVGDILRQQKGRDKVLIRSVSLLGQKNLDQKSVNLVRAVVRHPGMETDIRYDFFFDSNTKHFAGRWTPDEPDFEFESSEDSSNVPEKEWAQETGVGVLSHELVTNATIDASDFSMDPPVGFTFEKSVPATVTEDEMRTYLDAAVHFNNNTFPDSPFVAFDKDRFNALTLLNSTERTPSEQKMIELHDKFLMREIYEPPVRRFLEDHTVPDSFQYVGAGAALGEADRIVGWYKLRGAGRFRAVYADLAVRDVDEDELPLKLPN